MYVGEYKGRPCVISGHAVNNSLCVTGLSGIGKTSRIQQIELFEAELGGTVIVLDINQSHAEAQIFPPIRERFGCKTNKIRAMDGLGTTLFQPMQSITGEIEPYVQLVNSAVQALSSSQRMGTRQIAVLREAVIEAIKIKGKVRSEAEALAYGLSKQDGRGSQEVYQKLWTTLNCGALCPSNNKIYAGQINIIDFSGLDLITQSTLSEIFLSCLWRNVQFGVRTQVPQKITVVLDEYQNLSLKKDGVLRQMLREGRRFGLSLVLSTQTTYAFPREVLLLLQQAANHLYFKPAPGELRKVAQEIAPDEYKLWMPKLNSLRVGESIANGELLVNNSEIRRPIILR